MKRVSVHSRAYRFVITVAFFLGLAACSPSEKKSLTMFTLLTSDSTHIDFSNTLKFDAKFNIYTYRNFYNGGGVALGDINNDGLTDIYFSSNQGPNKLYLNKGNFVFEDITARAGVAGTRAWSTGVSMADINGDGWLDIYVCNSGKVDGDDKENELFVNNGDLTFTEQAEKYGVADRGYSTHGVFFDYDKDGDLDLYILNNSYQAIGSFNLRKNERGNRDELGGHKLMRNDGDHFTDVSIQAGILGSVIAFGLGVTVGDVNKDGWPDIYVSNDFFERDYLYINNQDGTFKECLPQEMRSISGASMGADMADINNDTYPDIFVTEMLPHENERIKTVTTFENWDRYQYSVTNDYWHQFTRNMLQLNNQDGTFSEVGRLSKVEATDWSWGALMFDADNDGLKDIFVANGIYQDLTNQDYLQYASSEEFVKSVISNRNIDYKKLIEIIPSNPIPDFFFRNLGNLQFENKAHEWGVGTPGFSNGSAYGDLDNDGDLDLVVNNVNMPAFVYRNNSETLLPLNKFLKVKLRGSKKNTDAVGTRVTVFADNKTFYLEQMPMRGFESTVDSHLNFGLGQINLIDRMVVEWPYGAVTTIDSVKVNQTISLQEPSVSNAELSVKPKETYHQLFQDISNLKLSIDFKHHENEFVDFDRERLIYQMVSTEGPIATIGDFDHDGKEDFYIGGAKDQPGALYQQSMDGRFEKVIVPDFDRDRISEDLGSLFFDADNDGDLDLYVCSGGSEFSNSSSALIDRLYFNDGGNKFTRSSQVLPAGKFESTSCVKAVDYDKDGDQDLFVGVRLEPFHYGFPTNGYILNNDGKGKFTDVTKDIAPQLLKIGMITDASWADIDGDQDSDLIVAGEWMPVSIFLNSNGKFSDQTETLGLGTSNGWWNSIAVKDIDADGDMDIVAVNHGLNSRFRASLKEPTTMYVGDFDENGSIEQIMCSYIGDKSYPMVLRHDLLQQLPTLKKKFLKYEDYKNATIEDMFSTDQLNRSVKLSAYEFSSGVFLNEGKAHFTFKALPIEAQFSSMYGLYVEDMDGDQKADILLGGNLYRVKPEVGRYDGSFGLFLKGDGKGNFNSIRSKDSGFFVDGEVRDIKKIKIGEDDYIIVARNNDVPVFFKINR